LPTGTEKTTLPASVRQWQDVFARAGLRLEVQASGCCGMSGTYGHEARNVATLNFIFEQSWEPVLDAADNAAEGELLATGYSCRSQAKRYRAQRLRCPVEVLAAARKKPFD
jgi:Fe-S oxidoreductase